MLTFAVLRVWWFDRPSSPRLARMSGTGHDAIHVARVAATSMIFVPCEDGVSHNEIEDARPVHVEAGPDVLLHAMPACASDLADSAQGPQ